MNTFRFIHCSDLHIDSPVKELSDTSRQMTQFQEATANAWSNIVDLALAEKVDAVLIAGDIFDGADRSLRAQFKFQSGLKRLSDAGIASFITCGNHDPLDSWSSTLSIPERTIVFPGDRVECRPVIREGRALAQIYGMSFPTRVVDENLAARFRREPKEGFAIGMLHTNVAGNAHHDNYAPCTTDDLVASGMDYWALGHIHKREVLRPAHPAIVYCGNAQARHFKETGAKGCCLVTLRENAEPEIQFAPTDALRFFKDRADVTGLESLEAVMESMQSILESALREAEGRTAFVRLTLTGRNNVRRDWQVVEGLRDLANRVTNRFSGLELELVDETRSEHDLEAMRQGQDFIADLLSLYDETDASTDADLIKQLEPVFKTWKGRSDLEPVSPEELRELILRARDWTLDQLVSPEEGA